ncbi:MAG: hypothetical protein PT120_01185 [Aphanizomenon gracile PMC649.10]|nr:hypothetical protein [Aphanizomenon gracile PMC638.10]MDM3851348.1 hypothetical protein [Aphanizomenon gracile PMC627.10]MDM3853559.1 hypothetical protein [Aphanizomenon gracile PMC649.10]MDM3861426.1 hypothetical protein [Aphanizomenon gracile PMC644.10]
MTKKPIKLCKLDICELFLILPDCQDVAYNAHDSQNLSNTGT